jgi:hypothetical protein
MHQWGYPPEMLIGDLMTCGPELIHDVRNAHSVPDQYGIGKQAEAACLVHDLFGIARAKLSAIRKEQTPTDQLMPRFAPVELKLNAVPEVWIGDIHP